APIEDALLDQHDVADVPERVRELAQQEHGLRAVDRVHEQDQRADQAQIPEGHGDIALARPFGGQPLHQEAGEEGALAEQPHGQPEQGIVPVHGRILRRRRFADTGSRGKQVAGCGFIWRSAATAMIACDPLAAARRAAWAAVVSGVLLTGPARADFPYPTCAATACADPADFGSYLFLAPGELPDDFPRGGSGTWKYEPETGLDITGAWQLTTGRPDVVGAILDS